MVHRGKTNTVSKPKYLEKLALCILRLHEQTFTPDDFYTRRPLTYCTQETVSLKKTLHQKPSTPKAIRTKELLHQKHFTPNDFYNRMRVHQEPYTPKELYTRKRLTWGTLLHQKTFYFAAENPYKRNCFRKETPEPKPFKPKNLYSRSLLHQRPFFTRNLLHQATFYTKEL